MIDICMLGTGGSLPLPDRALASMYLRYNGRALLIDCGEGTQVQVRRLGWGFRCVEGMLITHYHGDHCTGLPGFLLSMAKTGRDTPFHIWGPMGLKRVYEGLMVIAPTIPFDVVLHELPMAGACFSALGMDIEAFPLDHGVPCFGYSFQLNRRPAFSPEKARELGVPMTSWKVLQQGKSVVYNGGTIHPEDVEGASKKSLRIVYATDTRPTEMIAVQGKGSDLMILEGMYGDEEKLPQALKNHHMLFREAAELAAAAQTGHLILTHYSTSVEDPEQYLENATSVFPDTEAAVDGLCRTIRADGSVRTFVTTAENG